MHQLAYNRFPYLSSSVSYKLIVSNGVLLLQPAYIMLIILAFIQCATLHSYKMHYFQACTVVHKD